MDLGRQTVGGNIIHQSEWGPLRQNSGQLVHIVSYGLVVRVNNNTH